MHDCLVTRRALDLCRGGGVGVRRHADGVDDRGDPRLGEMEHVGALPRGILVVGDHAHLDTGTVASNERVADSIIREVVDGHVEGAAGPGNVCEQPVEARLARKEERVLAAWRLEKRALDRADDSGARAQ